MPHIAHFLVLELDEYDVRVMDFSVGMTTKIIKAERIENKAELLETNMKIFKRKLRVIMEQQMAVVEEIEILELDPR